MDITSLEIPGLLLITPAVYPDDRGYFMETYQQIRYKKAGVPTAFVQENLSFSRKGVLRGLHYQWPRPQGKLIQCLSGEVFDVVVDIRRGSPAFGKTVSMNLTGENGLQMYIPQGCAHGFLVLSREALFSYKCTEFYAPDCEQSLAWNDPGFQISWPIGGQTPVLSEKDSASPCLASIPLDTLPVYERGSAI